MKIRLEPCYPEGTTKNEQLQAVESEYQEVLQAIENESWREVAKELLDLAQTLEGLADVLGYELETYEYNGNYTDIEGLEYAGYILENLYTSKASIGYFRNKTLDYFITLVSKHDRNNPNYGDELIEQLLDQHYTKLEKRKKEWDGEHLEESEVIG